MHCGWSVDSYHTNNGIFTKAQFCNTLLAANQGHTISGVGAHHQNGLAEHTIKTIQDMTWTMMVHLSVHWLDEYDIHLWPFAMDYVMWLYNHSLHCNSGLAPLLNCEALCQAKVFGCPMYVLDPKLQDGNKIPKWTPCTWLGQFLGFSWQHSSSVGLVCNLCTNHPPVPCGL